MSYDISIHVPREGHDTTDFLTGKGQKEFLSTCPGRGTTGDGEPTGVLLGEFLSTCPGRGTTRPLAIDVLRLVISIHVPREGHDPIPPTSYRTVRHFYPRAPGGARLPRRHRLQPRNEISIHVPREGHDCQRPCTSGSRRYFYPRAPGGARPNVFTEPVASVIFLSTCPGRGTTGRGLGRAGGRRDFYPRAPGGARPPAPDRAGRGPYFYPRAPGGARRYQGALAAFYVQFLSTCPGRGTTDVPGAFAQKN